MKKEKKKELGGQIESPMKAASPIKASSPIKIGSPLKKDILSNTLE